MPRSPRLIFLRMTLVSFVWSLIVWNAITVFAQPVLYMVPVAVAHPKAFMEVGWEALQERWNQEVEQIKEQPFVQEIRSSLPVLSSPSRGDFPQNYTEYFQNMAQSNPLGLGALFRLDPQLTGTSRVEGQENISEAMSQGVHTRSVAFQNIRKFRNGELVYHKVIRNNEVVTDQSRPDDVSILHGIPDQMRRDGVNAAFIRFVQDRIDLVNYYLAKARDEKGLSLPPGDPSQLAVPQGYSPEVFQKNFIATIAALLKRS